MATELRQLGDPEVELIDMGYLPREWAIPVHYGIGTHRWSVVVVHRRGGKTWVECAGLTTQALMAPKPHSQFAFIAPELKQAKRIAWPIFKQFGARLGAKFSDQELSLELPNGSTIFLYGTERGNAEKIRGMYFDGIVIDEYASISPTIMDEIILPTLFDREGFMSVIGTFKGQNHFYDLFIDHVDDPEWYTVCLDVTQTNVFDDEQIAQFKRLMTPTKFDQEMLCDPTASADDVMIPIYIVAEAAARHVPHPAALQGREKVVGVDVARFGDDRSVIARRYGHCYFDPIVMHGKRNTEVAGQVARVIHDFEPDAVYIDAGRGEGVVDLLVDMGHSPVEVNFGGQAMDAKYKDKGTEMWDRLGMSLQDGGVLPDNPDIRRDLSTPTYKYTPSGQMVRKPKAEVKKESGRSPDIGDAYALTHAYHSGAIARDAQGRIGAQHFTTRPGDYDPYAGMLQS